MLGIATLAVLTGLSGAQDTGARNKSRSEYAALAQQDIERLRAKPVTVLSNYSTAAETARATNECSRYRASRTGFCTEIQFTATDAINGPFHTNDNLRICGGATFGRDTRDAIENQRLAPLDQRGLYRKPNVGGTLVHPASQLAHPPSSAALESVVQPAYKFKG